MHAFAPFDYRGVASLLAYIAPVSWDTAQSNTYAVHKEIGNGEEIYVISMSKADAMRSEYRREDLGEGVRGKYYKQFQKSSNVVVLDDDVADAFPNSQTVNEALRGLLKLAHRSDTQQAGTGR